MLERYDVVKKQAEALQLLINAGVPDDLALAMCGMPADTVLTPPKPEPTTTTPT